MRERATEQSREKNFNYQLYRDKLYRWYSVEMDYFLLRELVFRDIDTPGIG